MLPRFYHGWLSPHGNFFKQATFWTPTACLVWHVRLTCHLTRTSNRELPHHREYSLLCCSNVKTQSMYTIPKHKLKLIQRSIALLFLGLSIWLIAVALGLIDSSTVMYSRCRTCQRMVSPSIWTVSVVGSMFLSISISMLTESFGRKGLIASFFGTLGWFFLCIALIRHTLYSDDPLSVRLWTGALALVFSIGYITVLWSMHRSRRVR